MAREQKEKDVEINVPNYWIIIGVVVILGALVIGLTMSDDGRITRIGKAVCEFYNMSFNYAKGEYTHCYQMIGDTGIKQPIDLWMDVDYCEQKYLPHDENRTYVEEGLYWADDTDFSFEDRCPTEMRFFKMPNNESVACYRCQDQTKRLDQAISAEDWICPR